MRHSHRSVQNISVAFILNLGFAIAELAGGALTNSLAIVSNAVHDLGDTLTLGLAWYMERRSGRAENPRFSYGFGRLSLLSAVIGSIVLIVGSLVILSEAVPRLFNPVHSNAAGMIWFALVGIAVNSAAALRLRGGRSLNEQVVSWHFVEDILGWVAVLATGIIIRFRDAHLLDPVLSILIILYVLTNIVRNLTKTLNMFLQAVPEGVDASIIGSALRTLPHVQDVHDTHIWTLDGVSHVLTTHLVTDEGISKSDEEHLKTTARRVLLKHDIVHSTIEIEPCGQPCEPNELHRRTASQVVESRSRRSSS